MTQCAAVMTNRSEISAPPQKNSPFRATAACHVCSPTSASAPPMILRLWWPPSPASVAVSSASCRRRNEDNVGVAGRSHHHHRDAERRLLSRCRRSGPSSSQRPDAGRGPSSSSWPTGAWDDGAADDDDGRPQSGVSETQKSVSDTFVWTRYIIKFYTFL